MKSGFACIVGRPNVGKSTLTNALVGGKVAITSPHPQTTRHAVRGIVHRPDTQIVIVDTPGLHRPRLDHPHRAARAAIRTGRLGGARVDLTTVLSAMTGQPHPLADPAPSLWTG